MTFILNDLDKPSPTLKIKILKISLFIVLFIIVSILVTNNTSKFNLNLGCKSIDTLEGYNSLNNDYKKIYTAKVEEKNRIEQEIASRSVNGVYFACIPTSGTITSRFGSRERMRNHYHKGIDVSARAGARIQAAANGTVTKAGWDDGGYGNLVIINHGNGISSCYAHCSSINVSVGQQVNAGDYIATVGSTGNSTGNHLHFEIRVNGVQVDPLQYVYK